MNGILLVDKPEGWTSHDVVAKLRGALKERRVGHSGTLDPMATGLLVVFFGRATRAVEFAEADEKEYTARIRFGVETDTQDITGNIIAEKRPNFTLEELEAALASLRGEILQLPPMYSAIKVGGKKLYDIARRGGEVERKPRPVKIFDLEAIGELSNDMELRVRCSKGTYIRTLCSDIGSKLGCGACMSALRRTRAGKFDITSAHTLEEIIAAAENGVADKLILPTDSLFAEYEQILLSENQEKRLRNGGEFTVRIQDGKYCAYSQMGAFLALAEVHDGKLKAVKSFYEV